MHGWIGRIGSSVAHRIAGMLLGSLLLLALAGCEGTASPDLKPLDINAYQLAPGDIVSIAVFEHPEISGEFTIDGAGYLAMPPLGRVPAAGKTVEQLEAIVRVPLDQSFIVDPQVSVQVLTYRPIFVLGEVKTPGKYEYSAAMTVREAVALSGGYTRRARTSSMTLVRPAPGGRTTYDAVEDTPLFPGDTVEIQRRIF